MTIKRCTPDQLRDMADEWGMDLTDAQVEGFLQAMEGSFAAYDIVDSLPDEVPRTKYPRTPGYKPLPEENPHNAWYVKTTVEGSGRGKLKGKTVALKDNIMLAGVPMMNGASILDAFVPDVDATIVTRMLDAGATIVGKAHCEYYCFSSGSHTGAQGLVHNPRKMGYAAGGSSSGSAVVVALGEADMAIGGDQGGSIRMPAAFSGVVGHKPTFGLVPYTGVMPIENTIDHTGPMTRTVADAALLLEVLAGDDGFDSRQRNIRLQPYTKAIGKGAKGLKVAVITEGFGWASSDAAVDKGVMAAARRLEKAGATVTEVSIPMHRIGAAIWTPIASEGATAQMMEGNGYGYNTKGLYSPTLTEAHSAWRGRANELSDSLKATMFVGKYFLTHYRGKFYGKAQNINRRLKAAYDAVLSDFDVLMMPTVPMLAMKMPGPDVSIPEYCRHAFSPLPNTAPFDITGHPAISVPCGMSDGLPIGAMFVGKSFDDMTVLQAGDALEATGDWMTF